MSEIPDNPSSRLLKMIDGAWTTQAIHAAAELRIADLLKNGPRASHELASATGAHDPSLLKLMRALVALGLCEEPEEDRFVTTPTGKRLEADHPESLRSWAIWSGAHLWPVWGNLLYSLRTGRSARALLTGTEGFGHLADNPEAAAVFNQAQVELTRLNTRFGVDAYDFSRFDRVIDVGGGYGELLAAILMAHPHIHGVLFDLPPAIEGARHRFEMAGLAKRCEFVAGDFFESVPVDGDVYLLKSVIHDWDDECARRILETCRRAMRPDAQLLLIERLLPDRMSHSDACRSAARSDLAMLAAHGAGERTERQMQDLLAVAGFRVGRILPTGTVLHLIEAFVVQS